MAENEKLIHTIQQVFSGVELGDGVSWREADVIDDYGSAEARKRARDLDEKKDWEKIPMELIGNMRYQSVLSFLDPQGLKFHLPPCMIYVINHYKTSNSAIVESLIFTLAQDRAIGGLKNVLTNEQINCTITFLNWCKGLKEFEWDKEKIEYALEKFRL